MFDHVVFGVSHYEASKAFFLKALAPLGVAVVSEGPLGVEMCRPGNETSLCLRRDGQPASHLHLAFTAENRQQVRDFHRAALEAGGQDHGAPGLRPQYHPHYYAAFVIGPDGHNVEVVCHQPEAQSATSRTEGLAPADATMKIEMILDTRPAPDWLRLRLAIWPEATAAEHEEEMAEQLADPGRYGQWLARSAAGEALGLAEVSLRSDYVNGTETSPVAFLEGLYVAPEARQRGVARALLHAVAAWARARGCSELASDTAIDNLTSQAVHTGLGFQETERVVYFNKTLDTLPTQR